MNPFRRIALLERQVLDLQDALSAQSTTITALSAQLADQAELIKALVRDDAQIAALERIQNAVEYMKNAEQHDRQSAMKRHEF